MSNSFLILTALTSITAGVCLFAIWKGGQGERLTGILILAQMVLQRLAGLLLPESLAPTLSLIGDGVPSLVLLVLTVQFGSPWLGAIMFFYAAQFALHSFYIVLAKKPDLFHFIVNDINFAGFLICLVLGTVTSWARRNRILRERTAAAAASAQAA